MRRSLKPFVTEYKPSTRRQLTATRHSKSFATEPAPPTVKSGEGGRFDSTSRADDTYEAALRAADALFSPQKDRPQPALRKVGDDETEASAARDLAGRGSGRILRVLDEPSPEPTGESMREIEREQAPKRRGRKPGSKNRPKTDRMMTSLVTAGAAPSASRARTAPSISDMSDPASEATFVEGPTAADGEPVEQSGSILGEHADQDQRGDGREGSGSAVQDAARHAEAMGRVAVPSRERRRFSWVRTKLKPGQEWKRRLPKVCW